MPTKHSKRMAWWHPFIFVAAIVVMGIVFSSRTWILRMNQLNPILAYAVYGAILYGAIALLSRFDLVIFGLKIKSIRQTIGAWLMTFVFFMEIDWTSGWVQWVVTGSTSGSAALLTNNSEDGVSWYIWSIILPWAPPPVLRWVVFVFWGVLLAVVGTVLLGERKKITLT